MIGQHLLGLVALQMPDHVPTDFFGFCRFTERLPALHEFCHLPGTLGELLHTAFPQVGHAQRNQFTDLLKTRRLGDSKSVTSDGSRLALIAAAAMRSRTSSNFSANGDRLATHGSFQ